ncbi:uncharacterized protein LOC133170356 [Syngnathus typhle]|uniref:uncharacterized protein LOC133170356 n=1 Tax=Syngnathus typhle TaxID=161592 RepID=UPI002A6A4112|nr:uncharacterized protein LOC133170356 [Syngnathus typhle]
MHLKPKLYSPIAALFISTILTLGLPHAFCKPTSYYSHPNLNLTPPIDEDNGVTTKSLKNNFSQEDARRQLPSGRQVEFATSTAVADNANKNGPTRSRNSSETGREEIGVPDDCTSGQIQHVVYGKFFIPGQLKANIPRHHVDRQSHSDVTGKSKVKMPGQRLSGSEVIWRKLQPEVDCGDGAMTLTVRRRRAFHLLLDRGNESSLSLSHLPPQCGYSVETTWTELSLIVQYNACHVTQQGGSYMLPLQWRGTPVKMSCPLSAGKPPNMSPSSVCCSPRGMNVNLPAAQDVKVNVRGEWTPVLLLAQQCGYTLDRRDTEILIAAPFITCGITVEDGKHTLHLQIDEGTFILTCPIFPEETGKSLGWPPPFYLAPPYYPHPTYRRRIPGATPPATSPAVKSSPPEPITTPTSSGSTNAEISHLQGVSEQPVTAGSPVQDATSQPPSNHHPEIPQSNPTKDSDPSLSQKYSNIFAEFFRQNQQSEAEAASSQSLQYNPYYYYSPFPYIPAHASDPSFGEPDKNGKFDDLLESDGPPMASYFEESSFPIFPSNPYDYYQTYPVAPPPNKPVDPLSQHPSQRSEFQQTEMDDVQEVNAHPNHLVFLGQLVHPYEVLERGDYEEDKLDEIIDSGLGPQFFLLKPNSLELPTSMCPAHCG